MTSGGQPTSPCRACHAPMMWAITDVTGKRVPLDPEPVADGNVIIVARNRKGTPIVQFLKKGQDPLDSEAARYVTHHVTCTDPESFRKGK